MAPLKEAMKGLQQRRMLQVGRVMLIAAILFTATRWAWIGDDALITLRSALNLTHGWGWGYNALENVQSYTHPLWFLILAGMGGLTGAWVPWIFALSLGFTTVALIIGFGAITTISGVMRAGIALLLSNAFIEYSTSGLETPLAYLLIASLIVVTVSAPSRETLHGPLWILLGFLAALVVLTRMDLVLLIGPALSALWLMRGRSLKSALAAGIPFVGTVGVWLVIAWVQYGALLPNTFYAKTNVAIPRIELITQGLRYLYVSFTHDPISLGVLVAGLTAMLIWGGFVARTWASGIGLYLLYWVWVGGDFMAGRAIAVPVLVAALFLGLFPTVSGNSHQPRTKGQTQIPAQSGTGSLTIATAVAIPVAFIVALPFSNALEPDLPTEERWSTELSAGVADELGVYAKSGRMLDDWILTPGMAEWTRDRGEPEYPTSTAELDAAVERVATWQTDLLLLDRISRQWPSAPSAFSEADLLDVRGPGAPLGAVGVVSGPRVHLVDQDGLADAFLARQPAQGQGLTWRIGHFSRPLPDGYLEALRSGDPTELADPDLTIELFQLWDAIRE